MQGTSTGIGYGLKYQVKSPTLSLSLDSLNPNLVSNSSLTGSMHCRRQSRHRSHQFHRRHSQPQRRKRGLSSQFLFWYRCVYLAWFWMKWCFFLRCIWFGFHRAERNSCARVCSRIRTRSGTSLLVPLISAFSPLFSPPVIDLLYCEENENCLWFLDFCWRCNVNNYSKDHCKLIKDL